MWSTERILLGIRHVFVTRQELHYANFSQIIDTVAEALVEAISQSKGTCLSITPKRILEFANATPSAPIVFTILKYVLDKLVEANLARKDSTRAKTRYIVCKDSRIWHVAKAGDVDAVRSFIGKIVGV